MSMIITVHSKKFGEFEVICDAAAKDEILKYNWAIEKKGKTYYASAIVPGTRKRIYMHRLVMNVLQCVSVIDHINGNGLDNRRENLRICSRTENLQNRPGNMNAKSKYRGVVWNTEKRKWVAKMMYQGKVYFLGYYDDELTAAIARDEKAKQLHGEFVYLNVGKQENK